jgi:predicted unusual protein kinase regulating ubiquinone biosynthesis (AarF/ABC1/UbiB family)
MLIDMVAILRRHHLKMPADLTLLVKAFISLEGMSRELDPDFNMADEAMSMLERAMRARYRPATLIRRSWRAAGEAPSLVADLPHDLSRLLRAARRGRLDIHIDVTTLEARRQSARRCREPAGGRHCRRSADHRFLDRHDRVRRPHAAGAAFVRPARISGRRSRRRMAAAVDLEE